MIDFFTSKGFYKGLAIGCAVLFVGVLLGVIIDPPTGAGWGALIKPILVSVVIGGWALKNYKEALSKETIDPEYDAYIKRFMEKTAEVDRIFKEKEKASPTEIKGIK